MPALSQSQAGLAGDIMAGGQLEVPVHDQLGRFPGPRPAACSRELIC